MSYFIHLATLFSIYAILGVSLNLVVGFTGLVSVMHAAFFGIGAYAAAILMTKLGMGFFLAALSGILIAAVIGACAGWVFSRLGGDYYVFGSIAFNYLVVSVFVNWESLTNGPLGIPGIGRPFSLPVTFLGIRIGTPILFLFLTVILLGMVYWFARRVVSSSFGRVLKAIREDEEAARVFGYHTLAYKVAVSGIAAACAGLAGALFASYLAFIDPSTFDVMTSVLVLAVVVVGGFANIRGSLVGALILILLPEALRFAGFPASIAANMQQAVYGLALILFMLYRPQGIMGEYKF
ncbi:MAG: branched-chain amino acid ABC transporter permease [Candidatus Liptonbacteria bacterium]|nr:branched-chain amino acid ABC transporter permease [Candidatus Liptonbacteria bacterium]